MGLPFLSITWHYSRNERDCQRNCEQCVAYIQVLNQVDNLQQFRKCVISLLPPSFSQSPVELPLPTNSPSPMAAPINAATPAAQPSREQRTAVEPRRPTDGPTSRFQRIESHPAPHTSGAATMRWHALAAENVSHWPAPKAAAPAHFQVFSCRSVGH